ncbi:MAG: DUF4242 domain-containing protein [Acidimicrobiia bacterium]|nr:DUF4242 domain-containing protein [Acidimicrobiia bacterium]
MAMFIIEREFAERLELDADLLKGTVDYNDVHELRWLFSFLSADRRKTYCLYEAPNPEALRRQAGDLGLPADAIIEVTEINPEMFSSGTSVTGNLAS